jgi:glycosyltransferase involved in cell wall biosynthesis
MRYDLSILIPARNEEWLAQTVADLLKNKRGDTQILVGLDGYWADSEIPDHEDVVVVHYPESIGQRAMQNRLAQISRAKYVMKVDAHTSWDEGFDLKMIEAFKISGDDVTMVPQMFNLHVFNWRCKSCGMEWYQGPQPKACRNETCDSISWTADNNPNYDGNFEKKLIWHPRGNGCLNGVDCGKHRPNPRSGAYRFNKNLQFKYFPELGGKLPRKGLQETLSLQGSCFMCTRENYWKLELCDESWGSWGQQGSEVAIKTWLSGGRVLCNFDTWYAHLFRTQQGFSFPYPHSGRSQQRAREISQEIFLNDKWPKARYPLKWLLNKFWFALKEVQDPEAKWTEADL